MTTRSRAAVWPGLLGLLTAVLLVAPAPAASAAGRCPQGTGVTVVVDFGGLGGGVQVGCDRDGGGKPASRVSPDAGFPLTYVSSQPGFVCRVKGAPSSDPCQRTPPSNAYWGLFWSDGSPATWTYSSEGAASLDVPSGGSIGWRWQNGGSLEKPGAAPNRPAPPEPKPEPTKPEPRPEPSTAPEQQGPTTPKPDSTPGTTPPSSSTPSPAEQPGKKQEDRRKPPAGGAGKKPPPEAESPSASPTPTPDEDPTPVLTADTEPASGPTASTNGAVLPLVAGGLMLVLALLAGFLAWRRRT